MKKIACFAPYPQSGPSTRHRILALATYWQTAGFALTVYPFMNERFYHIRKRFDCVGTLLKYLHFFYATLLTAIRALGCRRFDMVIIHREAFPIGPARIERLICFIAKYTIYDLDDAIWEPPSQTVNQRRVFWSNERVSDIMRHCDVIIVGNGHIQQYATQALATPPERRVPIALIPTSYGDLGGPLARPPSNETPIIVWIGNEGNAEYLEPILPAFQKLAEKHSFILRLIGGNDIHTIHPVNVSIEHLRWSADTESCALLSSDIGIMPLPDNPYEQGKCGFKLVQYWSAGIPVVASPVGVNKTYVDGKNGFLAAEPADWVSSLDHLLNSPDLRTKMGAAGYANYQARFSREHCADRWLHILKAAA